MRDIEYPKPFENLTEYLMSADRIKCKASKSYIMDSSDTRVLITWL